MPKGGCHRGTESPYLATPTTKNSHKFLNFYFSSEQQKKFQRLLMLTSVFNAKRWSNAKKTHRFNDTYSYNFCITKEQIRPASVKSFSKAEKQNCCLGHQGVFHMVVQKMIWCTYANKQSNINMSFLIHASLLLWKPNNIWYQTALCYMIKTQVNGLFIW